ncbi:unnamed protein product [Caenorhabditis auriculariae]|uniref:Uncharacterized protein n=1 Tax=Caenorhabditis auriculariae TaxID=2777116 RepID=A0A8S1I0L7_9PELO|nr:unnamed protein product [Caenorhabditis auriculariae]
MRASHAGSTALHACVPRRVNRVACETQTTDVGVPSVYECERPLLFVLCLDQSFDECLNITAQQSTIDCSTSEKAHEARAIIEKNASNVVMPLSPDVKVKYFVKKWSTHAEIVKASRMDALTNNECDRAVSPVQSIKSSNFWEKMSSCFKKPRKAPTNGPSPKMKRRPLKSPEERRRYWNAYEERRKSLHTKRKKTAEDMEREERQKNENERIESLLGSENVRRAMLKSVSRPEAEKKANTLIVMKNVPEMVAALREPYFGYITKFLGEESISTLEVDLFFKMLQDILRCEHLLKIIEGFMSKIKEHIRSILTQRVICPDKSDLQLKKLRQLLRMRYHVWDETQSSEGFQTMNNLYPILWREFVGEKTTEQEDQDGKVVNDIGLRLEIPEIEQVDEDRLPAGDASQQQVVPEEIVELPDDFDAEKLDIEKDDVDLLLDVAVADLNPEVELNMEALRILRSLTHIKRCSQNCEEPSKKHAALVYDRLMMFAKSSDCDEEKYWTFAG